MKIITDQRDYYSADHVEWMAEELKEINELLLEIALLEEIDLLVEDMEAAECSPEEIQTAVRKYKASI